MRWIITTIMLGMVSWWAFEAADMVDRVQYLLGQATSNMERLEQVISDSHRWSK